MKQNISLQSLFTVLFAAFMLVFTASCTKPDDEVECPDCPPAGTTIPDSLAGELQVLFVHSVDGQPLVFSPQQYTNPANQPYRVDKLMYFISNVKLINSQTGKTFSEPNSYHLINPEEQKNSFNFKGVPVKAYDKIEFSIGVDSVQNSRIDQSGDLDPGSDMMWPWNTGYKFFSMEGFSGSKGLVYHIGSNSNYKKLSFPLNQIVTFKKDKPVTATVSVNLNELFRSPNAIDFNTVFSFMDGPQAKLLADNYADGMFNVVSISQ